MGLNKKTGFPPCHSDFAVKDLVGFLIQVKYNKNN
jgi:hypothetical protein